MANLIWYFDLGGDEEVTTTVASSKMGDGYEVRVQRGINSVKRKFSLTSTRAISENKALLDFLEARAGVESFTWEDAEGVTRRYVCRAWTKNRSERGLNVVNCDFEEVFEL